MDNALTVAAFIKAFSETEYLKMESFLADNMVSHVTNPTGGVDKLSSKASFMDRIKASNYGGVKPKITINQLVKVAKDQILIMVEVQAQDHGEKLHNHAAFLFHLNEQGKIAKMWMVEALPQYSDEFWQKASRP